MVARVRFIHSCIKPRKPPLLLRKLSAISFFKKLISPD
jgi:hypothetical protein